MGVDNISKHNVARGIDFTTIPKIMLLEAIVLQHFREHSVVRGIGFVTFSKLMLQASLVSQHLLT